MIMEKALKMEVVGPARVMILSGQFPSEMLMRAPLCIDRRTKQEMSNQGRRHHVMHESKSLKLWTCLHLFAQATECIKPYLLSHFLDWLSFLKGKHKRTIFTKHISGQDVDVASFWQWKQTYLANDASNLLQQRTKKNVC